MSKKFYTADWHLNSEIVRRTELRPFPSVPLMNKMLVSACNHEASEEDTVIHVGDLISYGADRGVNGPKENPLKYISQISSTFVNIEGNHDPGNKVKSIASYMRTALGPFVDVSVSHYPSYLEEAKGTFIPGDIHLCGHVHRKWKHYLDIDRKVLNINVGVDVWGYRPISEDALISYIRRILGFSNLDELRKLGFQC